MSENDNLLNADGKNEVEFNETTPTQETTTEVETKTETKVNVTTQEVETETKVEEKVEATENYVNEIEAANAEDAEDESNVERHDLEDKDYHAMTMPQLVTEFGNLLKHHKIQTISKHVNEIKNEFNDKFGALIDEKKEAFINEGGNEIDFYYNDDTKKAFNTFYKDYKQSINSYYKARERNLKETLENR